ncbi:MAG TPA: glycerol-3-phosphate dehydrogenase, partial [Burkholderiales bacterium]|nr:glycerol-3-phosphate dehydrogenase [Burkholderiales bacterium]
LGRFAPALGARRASLPASHAVRLDAAPYNAGLKPQFRHGFVYSDCRVDDARLVVINAMDARKRGAEILTRTECLSARRAGDAWHASLSGDREVHARAIVNAAGPWVKSVLNERLGQPSKDGVKLVKGSHIVLPQLYQGDHAFILQNDDRRVVFMIPYGERHTLVGTTDVAFAGDPNDVQASEAEAGYLCRAAGRYLARSIEPAEVTWRYAGVRPLYDDGTSDPSAITRDYTLRVDAASGEAPVLSIYGGKITTYRRLAEHALRDLAPYLPGLKGDWTAKEPLIGGDFASASREQARDGFFARYSGLPQEALRGLFRRHGMLAYEVLGGARMPADLGEDFGAELYAREVDYLVEHEWARTAEDVLWRRTKAGLHLTPQQGEAVARYLSRRVTGR